MTHIYKNGIFTGQMVDGKFVPLSPVPTGDAFDDLWDICCKAFEKHPRLKGKLHGMLTPNNSTGKHSSWLVEEVTVWIQEGDLRDFQQVNRAISSYADHWDRLVRVEAVNSWDINPWTLKRLRWFLGVPGSTPPPSKQEVLDEKKAWEAKEAECIRKDNIARREDAALQAKWDAEFELKKRIDKIARRLSDKLYSLDKIDFSRVGDDTDSKFRDLSGKRRIFRMGSDEIRFWIERGKTDDQIEEEIMAATIDANNSNGLSNIPPLEEGQTRHYFTESEWQKFKASGEWAALLDTFNTVLYLGSDDGRFYVMDTAPKSKDQPAVIAGSVVSEISEKADNGVTVECPA